MQDLLYRLTTTPVNEGIIWIILLILVFISLLLVITKFEDSINYLYQTIQVFAQLLKKSK